MAIFFLEKGRETVLFRSLENREEKAKGGFVSKTRSARVSLESCQGGLQVNAVNKIYSR